jgi:hypothetical protein
MDPKALIIKRENFLETNKWETNFLGFYMSDLYYIFIDQRDDL